MAVVVMVVVVVMIVVVVAVGVMAGRRMVCGYIRDIAEKGSERISMNRYVGHAARNN